ncbi:lipocalin family protein [Simiduia sp. 21SJ11W-1]|uniref:lipocalin family protein n=1 Tax=Simiduia sp. 21SJ11W-1 TaxID=2909669 RepID=UPI0020A15F83|nr:lipocalin family protein [Simiduia sp. 21SJ11W-1]UTA46992.1 lipocalin family protein [Simiduia sp. 21SJ11W-1]
MWRVLLLGFGLLVAGCTGLPQGIEPVANLDADRYLGKWYEVARLDHRFERGLSRVSAEYSPRDDGGINVLNRGYDDQEQAWQSAKGRAYFVQNDSLGHLKVSFFGPFYASYVIFYLDADYRYAFVSGHNRDYLWFLSREPQVPEALKQQFLQKVTELGFDASALIWVPQAEPTPAS